MATMTIESLRNELAECSERINYWRSQLEKAGTKERSDYCIERLNDWEDCYNEAMGDYKDLIN